MQFRDGKIGDFLLPALANPAETMDRLFVYVARVISLEAAHCIGKQAV
jgi:hypothetical protein